MECFASSAGYLPGGVAKCREGAEPPFSFFSLCADGGLVEACGYDALDSVALDRCDAVARRRKRLTIPLRSCKVRFFH